MSLIFGRFAQDFVGFQITRALADQGDPAAIANLPITAAKFRKSAGLNASYLVYIGISLSPINLPMKPQ